MIWVEQFALWVPVTRMHGRLPAKLENTDEKSCLTTDRGKTTDAPQRTCEIIPFNSRDYFICGADLQRRLVPICGSYTSSDLRWWVDKGLVMGFMMEVMGDVYDEKPVVCP